ncbi:hypothetical protein JNM05_14395 [bacterium]|nr:hypothetical protein [bacterium]
MPRRFKIILFLLVVLNPVSTYAGGSSYSYSSYGLVEFRPNIRALGMGGVNIAVPSGYTVNYNNPAGLIGLQMTRFEGSFYYEGVKASNSSQSAFSNSVNLNHIAFAIPFGKNVAAAFSLARYAKVEYNYKSFSSFEGTDYTEKFIGDGGLRQLAFTVAGKVHPQWTVGISAQYLLGSVQRNWQVAWDSPDYSNTNDSRTENFAGLRWVAGGIYEYQKFHFGAYVAFGSDMTKKVLQIDALGDTTFQSYGQSVSPFEIGLGGTYELNTRYMAGMDVVYSGWDGVKAFGNTQDNRNTIRVSLGAERSPSEAISASYFDKWYYRGGFYFQNMYASSAGGKFANEYFLTTGFGMPFNKGRNVLDVTFELGQRGTVSKNAVSDRVFRINFSVSGGERWFQNRQRR